MTERRARRHRGGAARQRVAELFDDPAAKPQLAMRAWRWTATCVRRPAGETGQVLRRDERACRPEHRHLVVTTADRW